MQWDHLGVMLQSLVPAHVQYKLRDFWSSIFVDSCRHISKSGTKRHGHVLSVLQISQTEASVQANLKAWQWIREKVQHIQRTYWQWSVSHHCGSIRWASQLHFTRWRDFGFDPIRVQFDEQKLQSLYPGVLSNPRLLIGQIAPGKHQMPVFHPWNLQ